VLLLYVLVRTGLLAVMGKLMLYGLLLIPLLLPILGAIGRYLVIPGQCPNCGVAFRAVRGAPRLTTQTVSHSPEVSRHSSVAFPVVLSVRSRLIPSDHGSYCLRLYVGQLQHGKPRLLPLPLVETNDRETQSAPLGMVSEDGEGS
jgi:hypothetical protein